jgi:hypothetical protein
MKSQDFAPKQKKFALKLIFHLPALSFEVFKIFRTSLNGGDGIPEKPGFPRQRYLSEQE